jgi:hypothetical protein
MGDHQDSHSSPGPRHSSILQLHPARPSPPAALLHSVLRLEITPPESSLNITFTIQPPVEMTNATTVSPSLQAVRESKTALSTYMASSISKADLFALPIPAERITLCIANATVVSNNFKPPSPPPIGFRLSNPTNVLATNGRPRTTPPFTGPLSSDHSKSVNCSHSSGSKNTPMAGYQSDEFDIASTPISPTLAPVAGAETKMRAHHAMPRQPSRRPPLFPT